MMRNINSTVFIMKNNFHTNSLSSDRFFSKINIIHILTTVSNEWIFKLFGSIDLSSLCLGKKFYSIVCYVQTIVRTI